MCVYGVYIEYKPVFADTPRPRGDSSGPGAPPSRSGGLPQRTDRPRMLEPPLPRQLPLPSAHPGEPTIVTSVRIAHLTLSDRITHAGGN